MVKVTFPVWFKATLFIEANMLKYELSTKTISSKQEFHFRNTSKEHMCSPL